MTEQLDQIDAMLDSIPDKNSYITDLKKVMRLLIVAFRKHISEDQTITSCSSPRKPTNTTSSSTSPAS
jgi:hypothetical protein